MNRQYDLIKGLLKTGGFAEMGITGMINPHITGVERVSDTQVKWTVENEYGESYYVTVTATKPTGQDEKRTSPQISITEVSS